MVVVVDGVGGAGEFEDGEVVADGEGEFGGQQFGVWGDNGGAKEMTGAVGK